MPTRLLCLFLALALFSAPGPAVCAAPDAPVDLDVLFIEYPPYYFTGPTGQPGGFFLERAARLLAEAGVNPVFRSMPSKRVLAAIQAGERACSLGWFKTPEREAFARFSLPVHVDRPPVALVRSQEAGSFAGQTTLAGLAASGRFSMGRIAGHSEGAAVDALLPPLANRTILVTGEQAQLFHMLRAGRFDFFLTGPEEIDQLLVVTGLARADFAVLPLTDLPQGNARHIMYSRAVDPDLVRRVDQAIRKAGFSR